MTVLPGDQPTPKTVPFPTETVPLSPETDAAPADTAASAAETDSEPGHTQAAETEPAGAGPEFSETAGSEAASSGSGGTAPRLRPRFAPIVWGAILLAFAAYVVVAAVLPTPPDPTFWLLGGIITVGLTLVVAGVAAAARRAG